MLELEEALKQILAAIPAPVSELVPLSQAQGRVLQENVVSQVDLPPFDNSAMDGYAVRAADVAKATADAPTKLSLAGRAAAGEVFQGEISDGQCVRLFTGSQLPKGADSVVMQEDTRTLAGNADEVLILEAVKSWD